MSALIEGGSRDSPEKSRVYLVPDHWNMLLDDLRKKRDELDRLIRNIEEAKKWAAPQ